MQCGLCWLVQQHLLLGAGEEPGDQVHLPPAGHVRKESAGMHRLRVGVPLVAMHHKTMTGSDLKTNATLLKGFVS